MLGLGTSFLYVKGYIQYIFLMRSTFLEAFTGKGGGSEVHASLHNPQAKRLSNS